jgi:ABC-type Mn2+/Zn2+ transport system ATPase subunit
MTAIMGPSGAGKTTFMNVLCGKVNRTSGTLWVNGLEQEMSTYKKIVGFVPQVPRYSLILEPSLSLEMNSLTGIIGGYHAERTHGARKHSACRAHPFAVVVAKQPHRNLR